MWERISTHSHEHRYIHFRLDNFSLSLFSCARFISRASFVRITRNKKVLPERLRTERRRVEVERNHEKRIFLQGGKKNEKKRRKTKKKNDSKTNSLIHSLSPSHPFATFSIPHFQLIHICTCTHVDMPHITLLHDIHVVYFGPEENPQKWWTVLLMFSTFIYRE